MPKALENIHMQGREGHVKRELRCMPTFEN
jgi:hypothetical protein